MKKFNVLFYINFCFILFYTVNINFILVHLNAVVIVAFFSSLFCLYSSYVYRPFLNNWVLIFFTTYFLFYFFGGGLGKLLLDYGESYTDLPTNFNTGISEYSEFKAYNYSAIVMHLILALYFLYPNDSYNRVKYFSSDNFFLKISGVLLCISIPMVLVNSFFELNFYLQNGFTLFYTTNRYESFIPFFSSIYNLFSLSSMIFLASKPSYKKFIIFSFFFLVISMIESLRGTRSVIIVNLFLILWYRADIYHFRTIKISKIFVFCLLGLVFLAFSGAYRQGLNNFEVDQILNLIFKGISMGQYQLALYLENIHLLTGIGYFFYPFLFPIYYFFYGESIAFQSLERTFLPMDINHTISSKLNQSAYISGAANGNNFVTEMIVDGILPLMICVFYFLYFYVFRYRFRSKVHLVISLIFLKHLIMAPRDTVLPNLWFVLKVLVFYFIIYVFREFWIIFNSRNRTIISK